MSAGVDLRGAVMPAWLQLQAALDDVEYAVPCTADPEVWSGDSYDPERIEYAELWCQTCPVITLCAAYADAAKERGAVWGGTYRTTNRNRRTA